MKRFSFLLGAVHSLPSPPQDEQSVFYLPLSRSEDHGGYVANLKIGGQDLKLFPSTQIETIGVSGVICKSSKKCNTPNTYNRGLSDTAEVVQEDDH